MTENNGALLDTGKAPAAETETKKRVSKMKTATELYEYARLLVRAVDAMDAQRRTAQEALKKCKEAVLDGRDFEARQLLKIVQDSAATILSNATATMEGLADAEPAPAAPPARR